MKKIDSFKYNNCKCEVFEELDIKHLMRKYKVICSNKKLNIKFMLEFQNIYRREDTFKYIQHYLNTKNRWIGSNPINIKQ